MKKRYGEGRIFPKEVYIAAEDEENAPGEWLTAVLENYIEGMLDGIYAENADLAAGAFDVLETLGRSDMEVFSAGLTPETIARMEKDPEVFAQAAGLNPVLAGILNVRACLNMCNGGDSVTQELKPSLISAVDLEQGAADALAASDGEMSALFNEDWMDALREYYKQ